MMDVLLVFIPVAWLLEHFAPQSHLLIFIAAGIAILPLAGWMGRATEHLAERLGEGIGGMLNATFGNAAELIIAIAGDGRSDWLKGVQLLAVYIILGMRFSLCRAVEINASRE